MGQPLQRIKKTFVLFSLLPGWKSIERYVENVMFPSGIRVNRSQGAAQSQTLPRDPVRDPPLRAPCKEVSAFLLRKRTKFASRLVTGS